MQILDKKQHDNRQRQDSEVHSAADDAPADKVGGVRGEHALQRGHPDAAGAPLPDDLPVGDVGRPAVGTVKREERLAVGDICARWHVFGIPGHGRGYDWLQSCGAGKAQRAVDAVAVAAGERRRLIHRNQQHAPVEHQFVVVIAVGAQQSDLSLAELGPRAKVGEVEQREVAETPDSEGDHEGECECDKVGSADMLPTYPARGHESSGPEEQQHGVLDETLSVRHVHQLSETAAVHGRIEYEHHQREQGEKAQEPERNPPDPCGPYARDKGSADKALKQAEEEGEMERDYAQEAHVDPVQVRFHHQLRPDRVHQFEEPAKKQRQADQDSRQPAEEIICAHRQGP